MEQGEFLKDPWVIAGVTFIAAVFIVPLLSALIRQFRSMFGPFSGQYLAITGGPQPCIYLVEDVKFRQIGNRLSGTIRGVATLELDPGSRQVKEKEKDEAKYRLNGFVDDRLLVVSYRIAIRGVRSTGSISLKGDSTGRVFSGVWAGLVNESVDSAPCRWVKLDHPISSKKQREAYLELASNYLLSLQDYPLNKFDQIAFIGKGFPHKVRLAPLHWPSLKNDREMPKGKSGKNKTRKIEGNK